MAEGQVRRVYKREVAFREEGKLTNQHSSENDAIFIIAFILKASHFIISFWRNAGQHKLEMKSPIIPVSFQLLQQNSVPARLC